MKRIGIAAIVLLVVAGLFLTNRAIVASRYVQIEVGGKPLRVETARSDAEISRGLGYRDAIGSDGMLFFMPGRQRPTFWMEGMRFNLDFVWIDSGKVVEIMPNVAATPTLRSDQLVLYQPHQPVTHVLEMAAGQADSRGIKVGDVVVY